MNIALVIFLHGSGGAERQIIKLGNALVERGHNVSLIALCECNVYYEISPKIRLIDLSYADKQPGFVQINRFKALYESFKSLKPDISIHYFFQTAFFSAFMPSKISGKVLFAERGDPFDKKDYNLYLRLLRYFANKRINGFVFQSNGAMSCFGNSVKMKSTVIPNSIYIKNIAAYSFLGNRDKVIVNVGRLHPQKNQNLLIEAFSKIASNYPEYNLVIFGDGELQCVLEAKIRNLNLSTRVKILPPTKDIFSKIYRASIFVLSSDFEGMPNALMEAMALGIPSISTDCSPGGARDLIVEGKNGWITPRGDAEALALRIAYVLDNRELAERVGINATSISETHSDKKIFDKWEDFLNKLIDNNN